MEHTSPWHSLVLSCTAGASLWEGDGEKVRGGRGGGGVYACVGVHVCVAIECVNVWVGVKIKGKSCAMKISSVVLSQEHCPKMVCLISLHSIGHNSVHRGTGEYSLASSSFISSCISHP